MLARHKLIIPKLINGDPYEINCGAIVFRWLQKCLIFTKWKLTISDNAINVYFIWVISLGILLVWFNKLFGGLLGSVARIPWSLYFHLIGKDKTTKNAPKVFAKVVNAKYVNPSGIVFEAKWSIVPRSLLKKSDENGSWGPAKRKFCQCHQHRRHLKLSCFGAWTSKSVSRACKIFICYTASLSFSILS